MDEINMDVEALIRSVEKKTALYQRSLKDYGDQNVKKQLWEEVCSEILCNWKKLTPEKKEFVSSEVKKKWINLRTCFKREMRAQKMKNGKLAKRRKYIYFKNLLFLKPHLKEESADPKKEISITLTSHDTFDPLEEIPQKVEKHNKKENPINCSKESLVNTSIEDFNEDKHFVLSLIPTLQSMTQDEKLEAKIEILQILRRIKSNTVFNFPFQP